jgi:8-oxo-dGTP diphosphatase/2-hydroxy-dATP diphosphatase
MSTTAMHAKVLTLCFLRDGDRVLLGMKKRGYGAGRWNGLGGKVEAGESVEEAAKRECREEAGVEVAALERRGILHFITEGDPVRMEVHVFLATAWAGAPVETEERPEWHALDALPFDAMWPDDRHWFPAFAGGEYFGGTFFFRGQDVIIDLVLRRADRWTDGLAVPIEDRARIAGR